MKQPSTTEIGLDQNGTTVELDFGGQLRVALPENPSTGYIWQLVTGDGLELVDDRYAGGREAIGMAATRILLLRATRPGACTLELAHYRPWEGSQSADRTAHFVVHVR